MRYQKKIKQDFESCVKLSQIVKNAIVPDVELNLTQYRALQQSGYSTSIIHTSTTSEMIRPYVHRDLVLKIFLQNVSVHNFILSMVLLVTLSAATINFFSR